MAHTLADVVEEILRDCAASVRPWQPEQMRRPEGVSLAQVEKIALQLEQMNLLEPDPHEKGYRASTQTRLILQDEKELRRFRRDLNESSKPAEPAWELPPNASPQHKFVFDTLHTRTVPVASRIIIGLNVAVFVVGLILAARQDQAGTFLQGGSGGVLEKTGGWTFDALRYEGRAGWVRLLTCCFVHIGLLHIGMNMYALNILGKDVEWLWGRWRFLVIYFMGGLGGSCMAVFVYTWPQGGVGRPPLFAGASGAICGLLAAEAVWLFVNRNLLPPKLVSSQMKSLGFNGVLIFVMSILPGVSGSAHLGGALGGAAAAYLLHLIRFGSAPLRWGAVATVVLLPLLMFLPLRAWSPDAPAYMVDVRAVDRESVNIYNPPSRGAKGLADVLSQSPEQRDPAEVESFLTRLPPLLIDLNQAARQLEKPDGAPEGVSDEDRAAAQRYFAEWAQIYAQLETALREHKPWESSHRAVRLFVDVHRPKWLDPPKKKSEEGGG